MKEVLLTKDEFLKLGQDLKCEYVPVPELKKNGKVKIRELTGEDRDALQKTMKTNPDGTVDLDGMQARTLALSLINEDGSVMFSGEEVQAIGKLSGKVLMRIYKKVSDLSGLGQKELDELVKNSEPLSQKEDSSSD